MNRYRIVVPNLSGSVCGSRWVDLGVCLAFCQGGNVFSDDIELYIYYCTYLITIKYGMFVGIGYDSNRKMPLLIVGIYYGEAHSVDSY